MDHSQMALRKQGVCTCLTLCMKVKVKHPFQHDRGGGANFGSKLRDVIYKCPLKAILKQVLTNLVFVFIRSRRGFEGDSVEDPDLDKRAGSHGYLLRTRKSDDAEPTTRNTRGSYLFRTRKSDPNLVPERNSRGAGYLFRTRKSDPSSEELSEQEMMSRMLRSSKGYLFRTRKSEMPSRYQRGGSYLFRT